MKEVTAIQNKIHEIRGQRVMLDSDLALMYGVETRVLNQAVKRNIERFPEDFMFQLTKGEFEILKSQILISNSTDNEEDISLKSQIVTLKGGRGQHKKYLPYAFTELGVAMLSSVLRSPLAIQVNIGIMRAFVTMRQALTSISVSAKIDELEGKIENLRQEVEDILHDQNDINESHRAQLDAISTALAELQPREPRPRRRIGFIQD
ncbi:MAG: ORF6N domain-containing protein [Prevotella sp.]|nr:ORF6N domain-containing protein [Prevotella sp.]